MSVRATQGSPQQATTEAPAALGSVTSTSVTLDQSLPPRSQFPYHQHRGSD